MSPLDLNIFIPELMDLGINCQIRGYVSEISDNVLGIYIIEKYSKNKYFRKSSKNCCSKWTELNKMAKLNGDICCDNITSPQTLQCSNYISFQSTNGLVSLKRLILNGKVYLEPMVRSSVIMFYDYNSMLKSEAFFPIEPENSTSTEHKNCNQFALLKNIIHHDNSYCPEQNNFKERDYLNFLNRCKGYDIFSNIYQSLCGYSNLCVQLCSLTSSISWIVRCICRERKISVRPGNLIASLLIDLLGGIVLLYCINQWTSSPVNELFDIIELIVDNLRALLKWLMGSPAGLKLNHAFNNMLGKFFLYHIELWWMFLVITKNILEMVLQIFQYAGMLGISFQAAILADMLSLASFHIYCIYTYAARLYNIQVCGLIALWRLFLGRKHNPLRGGVDSCQYNHHQLFVGTLAFTILLFLLPTTALYYVVFTMFRVILVMLGGVLMWIRHIIQSLPLYLIVLWLIKSRKIAGEIKISLLPSTETHNKPTLLKVHLETASIFHLIRMYQPPPFSKPVSIQWGEVISSLCRGRLLYPL